LYKANNIRLGPTGGEELEKELVALFATIAAIHYQEEWASNSKLVNRGKKELKNCHVLSIMILNVA
jgi:hypothetical protein